MSAPPLHAGLIARYDRGAWRGVLIQGPSGVGKSDLALRALDLGFVLVADDRTQVWSSGGGLWGACPPAIAGLMELRGLGVAALPTRPQVRSMARIRLIVRCLQDHEPLERTPETAAQTLCGVTLPLLALRPLEASAPGKLLNALSLLGGGR